jgi:hypothetical protein
MSRLHGSLRFNMRPQKNTPYCWRERRGASSNDTEGDMKCKCEFEMPTQDPPNPTHQAI